MKKLCIALAAVFALSAAASAEVGVGLKLGMFKQSDNLDKTFAWDSSDKISDDKYFGGLEFLFQDYFATNSMIGFKVGAEMRAPLKRTITALPGGPYLKNDLYTFPVTLYYKYAPTCFPLEFWLGGGVSAGYSKWTSNYVTGSTTASSMIVFPHLNAGLELRASDHIGIGIDGAYNFNAKSAEDFGVGRANYKRDISGLEGNLALRYYF